MFISDYLLLLLLSVYILFFFISVYLLFLLLFAYRLLLLLLLTRLISTLPEAAAAETASETAAAAAAEAASGTAAAEEAAKESATAEETHRRESKAVQLFLCKRQGNRRRDKKLLLLLRCGCACCCSYNNIEVMKALQPAIEWRQVNEADRRFKCLLYQLCLHASSIFFISLLLLSLLPPAAYQWGFICLRVYLSVSSLAYPTKRII